MAARRELVTALDETIRRNERLAAKLRGRTGTVLCCPEVPSWRYPA